MKHLLFILSIFAVTACNSTSDKRNTLDTQSTSQKSIPTEASEERAAEIVVQQDTVADSEVEEVEVIAENTETTSEEVKKVEEAASAKIKEDKETVSTAIETQEIKPNKVEEIDETAQVDEDKAQPETPNHKPWDNLLRKYVTSSGSVNYEGLAEQKSALRKYIDNLVALPPTAEWSKDERLAYWINIYNALTVDLILKNYPVKSILDINNGKAWDLKVVTINGKGYSLNDIEHKTIRKRFREPRIHFAVNCAALSCPKLLNSAYWPSKLDEQLDKQTRYFIDNKSKNQISGEDLSLSKIFEWYAEDFGDVRSYLKRYKPDLSTTAEISFAEYDWALNQ